LRGRLYSKQFLLGEGSTVALAAVDHHIGTWQKLEQVRQVVREH